MNLFASVYRLAHTRWLNRWRRRKTVWLHNLILYKYSKHRCTRQWSFEASWERINKTWEHDANRRRYWYRIGWSSLSQWHFSTAARPLERPSVTLHFVSFASSQLLFHVVRTLCVRWHSNDKRELCAARLPWQTIDLTGIADTISLGDWLILLLVFFFHYFNKSFIIVVKRHFCGLYCRLFQNYSREQKTDLKTLDTVDANVKQN